MGFGVLLERIRVMVICYISVDGFADQRMKKRETRNIKKQIGKCGREKDREKSGGQ